MQRVRQQHEQAPGTEWGPRDPPLEGNIGPDPEQAAGWQTWAQGLESHLRAAMKLPSHPAHCLQQPCLPVHVEGLKGHTLCFLCIQQAKCRMGDWPETPCSG